MLKRLLLSFALPSLLVAGLTAPAFAATPATTHSTATPTLVEAGEEAAANATFNLGKKAYEEKRWIQAIYYMRPLAESGDERAMIILGNMYSIGLGVSQDYKQAFSLYHKAALRNNTDAIFAVASLYQKGLGTQHNVRLATEWYARGARLGHRVSALYYALNLYKGNKGKTVNDEVKPDHPLAYKWALITSLHAKDAQTQKVAKELADRLSKVLTPEQLATGQQDAVAWKDETVEQIGAFPSEVITPAAIEGLTVPQVTVPEVPAVTPPVAPQTPPLKK